MSCKVSAVSVHAYITWIHYEDPQSLQHHKYIPESHKISLDQATFILLLLAIMNTKWLAGCRLRQQPIYTVVNKNILFIVVFAIYKNNQIYKTNIIKLRNSDIMICIYLFMNPSKWVDFNPLVGDLEMHKNVTNLYIATITSEFWELYQCTLRLP